MKTFIKHDFPALQQTTTGYGRTYSFNGVRYPSVTSVTGLHSAAAIAEWRKKVGAEEANRISSKASKRGTSVHSLCEAYLKGDVPIPPWSDIEVFNSLTPHLDKIDNIHCMETPLISHHLKVAGTVDVIGEYDGAMSVIDFKTSLKPKLEEWVHGYFMQTAAYSFMFWEMSKILVENLVIIIGVDDNPPQVFTQPVMPWLKQFKALRQEYKVQKGL